MADLQTLDQLVEELSEVVTSTSDGLPSAMLHLVDNAGAMSAMAMPVGDAMVAPLARLLVARQDPALAVLAVEVTATITRTTEAAEKDPDKRRLLRGEVSVGKLPADKRRHMLLLYGEDRAGHEALRLWDGGPADRPRGPRRYVPFEHEIADIMRSRLRPLYSFRELMAQHGLIEYQARKLARERAAKELTRLGLVEQPLPDMPPGPVH